QAVVGGRGGSSRQPSGRGCTPPPAHRPAEERCPENSSVPPLSVDKNSKCPAQRPRRERAYPTPRRSVSGQGGAHGGDRPMTARPGLPAFLRDDFPYEWHMTPPERAAIILLLDRIKPPVAVEVGTHRGGSLQIIAGRSGRVYSIDINPGVVQSLGGRFNN